MLDGSGFVRRSEVFAGRVDEDKTLEPMLKALHAPADALVVMDAGIATEDNVAWLRDNVNKTATAVQLKFKIVDSPSLPEAVRERLAALGRIRERCRGAGQHYTVDVVADPHSAKAVDKRGVLTIEAKRYRDQSRNREDALERLVKLIRKAAEKPVPRRLNQNVVPHAKLFPANPSNYNYFQNPHQGIAATAPRRQAQTGHHQEVAPAIEARRS